MNFNKAQLGAIEHKDGAMLVLAGPGSGKTAVITHRTKNLITKHHVKPSEILVITFTKAAANEMKERFNSLMKDERVNVSFGTFHAVFFTILKYAYRFTSANIADESVRYGFIREILSYYRLEYKDENEFIGNLLAEISLIKNSRIDIENFYSGVCGEEIFRDIYKKYETRLKENRLIDFDDMLSYTYELFKERPDILALWQNKYKYILIDEFQDINRLQYEIIKMLAAPQNNLFIVGDDDQSIYRFRGARPEIMLGFEKDYPDAKKVILNTNYRCSAEIVDSAEHLISHNTKRFPKNMQAARGKKVPITFRYLKDAGEECTDILKGIRFYHKKGIPLEEMAVIFRTNTQPRLLVGRLMEYNIPFQMRDVIPNIFDHWIARNILTYIKIAMGNKDRKLFLQIMNRPKRYISRSMLTDPQVDLKKLKQETFGKKWLYEKIDKLEMDLCLLRKMEPYAAIQYIRNGIGYEDYMNEYAQFRRMNPDDLEEVLNQIQESAKEYHSFEEWFSYIDSYGEELEKQMEAGRQQQKSGVTLTTMHSSKGLEYEVVFVMDINEGTTPHKKAVKDADLEEERRLFYVAVTRAKTYLFLYSLKELYQKDAQISRYIGELRYDKKEFKKGRRVVHKNIGKGTILELKDEKIKIRFDNSKKPRLFSIKYLMEQGLLELE